MRAWRATPQWGRGPPSSPFVSTTGRRSRCTSLCAASLSRDDPASRRRRRAATSPTPQPRTQARSRPRREDEAANKRCKRPQETAIQGPDRDRRVTLLGSSPNRRLTKDERQSPAIAEAAASTPSRHGRLMRTAAQAARRTAAATPRQVLERPNRRWPSRNTIPPSIG
jgi:hypothetical protein